MPRARQYSSGRYQRRPLVNINISQPVEVTGWLNALDVLKLFVQLFPEQAQQLQGIITPTSLYEIAKLFHSTASAAVPLLEPSLFVEADESTNEGCLEGFALSLFNLEVDLWYAVGVNDIFDGVGRASTLTLALWHLFSHTSLGFATEIPISPEQEAISEVIAELQPLMAGVSTSQLFKRLGPWWSRLILYAFGCTDNAFADISFYELGLGFDGSQDHVWEDFWEIKDACDQARRIAHQYARIERWIEADAEPRLQMLAERLHLACFMEDGER